MAKCWAPVLKWQFVRSNGPPEIHLSVKFRDPPPPLAKLVELVLCPLTAVTVQTCCIVFVLSLVCYH
jgi:hypothetical protein